MLKEITFKNYKAFREKQTLELKPLTILIGKNSSGKSAIAKLPTLIEGSLSGRFSQPLEINNNGIELGGNFRDLVYNHGVSLEFGLKDQHESLLVSVASGLRPADLPKISNWKFTLLDSEISTTKGVEDNFEGFLDEPSSIKSLSLHTDYIGPFRALPERSYPSPTSILKKVGIHGEDAYSILIQDAISTEQVLLKKVNDWYQENFEGWGITVEPDGSQYAVKLIRKGLKVNLKDVGQGMSQAFPLVVRTLMPATKETLIIMEQPELHLHPAAHGNLAELFADSLTHGNKSYLIETHSRNFVLRIRRLIAEKELSPSQVNLYYVDFNEEENASYLEKIELDTLGKVASWPENIFSEALDEASAIRTAQIKQERDAD
jgi:hypothetical protein